MIDDIKKRLELKKKNNNSENYEAQISKENLVKDRLIQYANIITSFIGKSEKNIYDLNGLIAKYKEFENEAFKLIFEKNIREISEDLTNINPPN